MKKAVVVGGSGFIGSHVADELSRSGFDTTIFDVHSSPFLKKDKRCLLEMYKIMNH